jgi:hypothetical protein
MHRKINTFVKKKLQWYLWRRYGMALAEFDACF